jgi:5-methylcytosine-specific restriction endonuclease McrA
LTRQKNWYERMLRLDVVNDLEKHPELITELGRFKDKFINWAAKERVSYEADIHEEFNDFIEKVIKSRLYNSDVKLWKKISLEVFERDKFTCAYCGKTGGKIEVDHIVPISKGGSNHLSNLVTACVKCNRQKKDKTIDEFMLWREEK